jgi:molecular chaperone HscB
LNYFEIFDIPVQLKIDKSGLSKKYFELSRKFHPDYFANHPLSEQTEALEISAQLNKAYKTFQNEDETIKYVLQLKELLEEEEKYQLPQDFLMEVLEINETLMDENQLAVGSRQFAGVPLLQKINQLQQEIYEPVKEIVEHYKEGVTSKEELLQVKEYYYKKKYLDRIRREIGH